jgi:hypothetical protein
MIVNILKKDNLDLVVIDDFYNPDELVEVNKEIKELYKFRKHASLTATAKNDDNTYLKTGKGLWLYDMYYDRQDSSILTYNQKLFKDSYLDKLIQYNINYKHINKSNFDNILLNYYDNAEQYDHHEDITIYTVLILLNIGSFKGGGVYFKDVDEEIEFKENRAIIFPGCATHKGMPIQGDGTRVSIAQFIRYKDEDNR